MITHGDNAVLMQADFTVLMQGQFAVLTQGHCSCGIPCQYYYSKT